MKFIVLRVLIFISTEITDLFLVIKICFKDKNSNTLELDGFNVIIDENLLRSKFTKFVDKDKNIF